MRWKTYGEEPTSETGIEMSSLGARSASAKTVRRSSSSAITPLSDGCGVVEAVGEGVTRVAVGDRVASMFYQTWLAGPPWAAATGT